MSTHRDVGITRETVQGWVDEWNQDQQGTLEEFVRAKLEPINHPDTQMEGDEQVSVADKIIADLPSYG